MAKETKLSEFEDGEITDQKRIGNSLERNFEGLGTQ